MSPDAGGVAGIPTAGSQVRFVAIERLLDREGLGRLTASCERSGLVLRLPEIEYVGTISIVEVVCGTNRTYPVATLTIGDAHYPRSGSLVTPIP